MFRATVILHPSVSAFAAIAVATLAVGALFVLGRRPGRARDLGIVSHQWVDSRHRMMRGEDREPHSPLDVQLAHCEVDPMELRGAMVWPINQA